MRQGWRWALSRPAGQGALRVAGTGNTALSSAGEDGAPPRAGRGHSEEAASRRRMLLPRRCPRITPVGPRPPFPSGTPHAFPEWDPRAGSPVNYEADVPRACGAPRARAGAAQTKQGLGPRQELGDPGVSASLRKESPNQRRTSALFPAHPTPIGSGELAPADVQQSPSPQAPHG